MNKTIKKSLCVDAGSICVFDEAFIAERGGKLDREDLFIRIPVASGRYSVSISIPNTWRGRVRRKVTVDVQGSAIIVGDLCYHFADHDVWLRLLKTTDYLSKIPAERGVSIDTGGDGVFKVSVMATPRKGA